MMLASVQHLHGYNALPVDGLNVYDILRMESLVVEKDAIDMIIERLPKMIKIAYKKNQTQCIVMQ